MKTQKFNDLPKDVRLKMFDFALKSMRKIQKQMDDKFPEKT